MAVANTLPTVTLSVSEGSDLLDTGAARDGKAGASSCGPPVRLRRMSFARGCFGFASA